MYQHHGRYPVESGGNGISNSSSIQFNHTGYGCQGLHVASDEEFDALLGVLFWRTCRYNLDDWKESRFWPHIVRDGGKK